MTLSTGTRGRPRNKDLSERRKAQILDGAVGMFASQGYPKTDVQALADSLKLGKGTIYRYFPSKRALFLAAVDRGMRMLSEHVDAAADAAKAPMDRIKLAIRAYLSFFDDNPEYIELIIQERAEFKDRKKPTYFAHREANLGPWKELISSLIASGQVRAIPVDRIIDVISDLLYGTIFTNHFAGRRKSFEHQTRDVLDILLNGISRKPKEKV